MTLMKTITYAIYIVHVRDQVSQRERQSQSRVGTKKAKMKEISKYLMRWFKVRDLL